MRAGASLAAVLLAGLLLGGCGLHLQGRLPLPEVLERTWVEAEDGQSEFVLALRRGLVANGAVLVDDAKSATAVVRVLEDRVSEEVLSVSARNLPRELEIIYTVEFTVRSGTDELLEPQRVELRRELTFDETVVLAKEREKEILEDALARDLAAIVMRRLSAMP